MSSKLISNILKYCFSVKPNIIVVTEDALNKLEELNIPNLSIQVSLDSYKENEHGTFRGYKGAYKKAIEVLKRCAKSSKLISSMRVSF